MRIYVYIFYNLKRNFIFNAMPAVRMYSPDKSIEELSFQIFSLELNIFKCFFFRRIVNKFSFVYFLLFRFCLQILFNMRVFSLLS